MLVDFDDDNLDTAVVALMQVVHVALGQTGPSTITFIKG